MKVEIIEHTKPVVTKSFLDVPINAVFTIDEIVMEGVPRSYNLFKKVDRRHAIRLGDMRAIAVRETDTCHVEPYVDAVAVAQPVLMKYGQMSDRTHFEFGGEQFIKDFRVGAISLKTLTLHSFPSDTLVRAASFSEIRVDLTFPEQNA